MEPEERLDALLSASAPRDAHVANAAAPDDELAPQLAAAGRLAELRHAQPAPDFARALQTQLLARADHLRTVQATQATTEASADPTTDRRTSIISLVPRSRSQRPAQRTSRTPRALWPALAAAVLLALGVGTFSATAHAGPQSPFYGLHRTMENAQVQLASSQVQRTQLHVQYADEALAALDAAAHSHDDAGYTTALATLQSETTAAQQSLAKVPSGSDHDALANQMNALRSRTWQDLAAALGSINWANRVSTTGVLGGIGAAVPRVSSATITEQDGQSDGGGQGKVTGTGTGSGQGSNGSVVQVIVNGSGFESGARLMANGQPVARVTAITVTSGQIVAVVQPGAIEGAHSIGVSNPDGSAAETTNITRAHGQDNGDNGDNGNGKRSSATPTPTPDHGKGRHP